MSTVTKGRKRLKILISVSALVSVYVSLIASNWYGLDDEFIFITFPIASALASLSALLLTSGFFWVIDGYSEDNKLKPKEIASKTLDKAERKKRVDVKISLYIRSTCNSFERFCHEKENSIPFDIKGPFFSYALISLALMDKGIRTDDLIKLSRESFNKVLEIDTGMTNKAFCNAHGMSLEKYNESMAMIGVADMEMIAKKSNDKQIIRLEEAIDDSFSRIKNYEPNIFNPILEVIMSSNINTNKELKDMIDDIFADLFKEICNEEFRKAKNVAEMIHEIT